MYSNDLAKLFPASNEIAGWKISDSIKNFNGDDLFTYIDGGADIFIEYGFKQVSVITYSNKGKQIQVEIYDMKDQDAAYGAYSFYLNSPGKAIPSVATGVFIDYYAAFYKGNMLVVVSEPTPEESLFEPIRQMTQMIDKKMQGEIKLPQLVQVIQNSGFAETHVKYVKGNVGLSNIYRFIPGNAFTFNEGISFGSNKNKVIVLQCIPDSLAAGCLNSAYQKISKANKNLQISKQENAFSYQDFNSMKVLCSTYKRFVLVIIESAEDTKINDKLKSALDKIKE